MKFTRLRNWWEFLARSGSARPSVVEIGPEGEGYGSVFRDVWDARRLLIYLVARDLKGRYRGTYLGDWWILLRPAILLLPYMIVFGVFLKLRPSDLPYVIYVVSGFGAWFFLNGCITGAAVSFAKMRSLISKVYFPRLIVPLSDILLRLVDYGVVLAASLLLGLAYGILPSANIWALPLYSLLLVALALGGALIVSTLCANRPDLSHGIVPAMRFVFYATPVAYPISVVPEKIRMYYELNPISTIIAGLRWSLFGAAPPSAIGVAVAIVTAAVLLLIGLRMFLRLERHLSDIL